MGSKGHLPVIWENWGLFLPPASTLRGYLPLIDPYKPIDNETIVSIQKTIHEALKDSNKTGKPITIGWIADEIEIRKGLVFNSFLGSLIGRVDGPFLAQEAMENWNENEMKMKFASHVLQIFICTTDGQICLPLGYLPTVGISGKELFERVKSWKKKFSEGKYPLELLWGSTDGFSTNHEFLKLMSKEHPSGYYHIFDYVHIIKNLRNTILNKRLISSDIRQGFHMNDLIELRSQDPEVAKLLKEDLIPKDKMNLKNVEQLLNDRLIEILKRNSKENIKSLGNYFHIVKKIF
eukprot:Pompholyxophrys_punicea_v1_NODE_921_length_1136_cov_3.724329.p1 type:complete len:292 gc:universal NODE_921_length_1136_cov_3.724329:1037-162(-)